MNNNRSENKTPIPIRRGIDGQKSMSKDEMRSAKKKKLLRKRKIKNFIFSAFLLTLVVAAGVILAFTVFFKIEKISVENCSVYPKKSVIAKCGVAEGDNLLAASSEKINKALSASLPYIDSVTVKKKLPGTLVLSVTETREKAAVSYKGAFVLLDGNGKILDSDASLLRENVALIEGIKAVSPKEGSLLKISNESKQDIVLKILKGISAVGIEKTSEINVTDLSKITLQYDNRIKIKLGDTTDLDLKLKRAKAALDREDEINNKTVGVLDVRSSPYAYFRAGEDTEATKNKKKKSEAKNKKTKSKSSAKKGN